MILIFAFKTLPWPLVKGKSCFKKLLVFANMISKLENNKIEKLHEFVLECSYGFFYKKGFKKSRECFINFPQSTPGSKIFEPSIRISPQSRSHIRKLFFCQTWAYKFYLGGKNGMYKSRDTVLLISYPARLKHLLLILNLDL